MPIKYYGVNKGILTGVFRDWEIVKKFVNGYSGAKYKSFLSYEEAEYFYINGKCKPSSIQNQLTFSNNIKKCKNVVKTAKKYIEIYTDGSCRNENGGYGIVVLLSNDKYRYLNGPVPYNPCTNQIAELYAIYIAANEYPDKNIKIYTDSMYCINIFKSWYNMWENSSWKKSDGEKIKNIELIKNIKAIFDNFERTVEFEHVRAHKGHPLNEMADTLAKDGINLI